MEAMIELSPDAYRTMAQAARTKAETEFSLLHEVSTIARWMADERSEEVPGRVTPRH